MLHNSKLLKHSKPKFKKIDTSYYSELELVTLNLSLVTSDEYQCCLVFHPELLGQVANGVGSQTSWTYHFTPNTIWGLNINPSAYIHDWDYTYPYEFKTYKEGMAFKKIVDKRFYQNVRIQIKDGCWILRGVRRQRSNLYYFILRKHGHDAFWCNKKLPKDYPKDREKPEFNKKVFKNNKYIWTTINQL